VRLYAFRPRRSAGTPGNVGIERVKQAPRIRSRVIPSEAMDLFFAFEVRRGEEGSLASFRMTGAFTFAVIGGRAGGGEKSYVSAQTIETTRRTRNRRQAAQPAEDRGLVNDGYCPEPNRFRSSDGTSGSGAVNPSKPKWLS